MSIAVLLPTAAAAQVPSGRITGVVSDTEDRPVPLARVRLASGREALADEEGRFALDGVEAGRDWIAAIGPRCVVTVDSVRVAEEETATVRLRLTLPVGGEGQGVGVVFMSRAELRSRSFRSVYEALRALAPYMVSHITGEVGGDRWVSNRAARTFAGNEPVYILDGIRITNVSMATLEDIPVEDLERIEVARGASASFRYGLGSAGGAVVLTTSRAGPLVDTADLAACAVSFPEPW